YASHALSADAAAARDYIGRGLAPIPVPHGTKAPVIRGWQNLRITDHDVDRYFSEDANVGILNGAPSGGLVDIDLDAAETLVLANEFLPPTDLVFGRASKPRSHWEYLAEPAPETKQYRDTDHTMLVELRSTGSQTVWPPSLHPTGEGIAFDRNGSPTLVAAAVLQAATAHVALCALLVRHWPRTPRTRHDIAL